MNGKDGAKVKHPSMRRSVTSLAALYAISLMIASGCLVGWSSSEPEANAADASAPQRSSREPSPRSSQQAAGQLYTARKPAFDPVKVNGQFFQGWKKPKVAIVITGRQDGYLEPCGCAGLENQKGGLSRRHAMLKELAKRGWPLAPIDVGNQVRRFGRQAEIQFSISAEALKKMGYQAVGLGPDDLRLSAGTVAAAAQENDIFVSANASVLGLTPTHRIFEAGGMKIGITSIIGPDLQKEVNNPEIEFQPASAALKKVLPDLEPCDFQILLAQSSVETAQELAKAFKQFNVVVTSGGADEPPGRLMTAEGSKTPLVEVGHKGMYCVVLGLYDDARHPIRYQRVALDSRYPNTSEMKQLMRQYQEHLKDVGWEGLELRPTPHPRAATLGKFVGAANCKECHPTAWAKWHTTKHSHATESLTKLDPPRQYDAECVSCHTTGWNPQEYFSYQTGFDGLKTTPHMVGNGCENCHGPGGNHVAAEKGKNRKKREDLRAAMRLTQAAAQDSICGKCHDLDNSPHFDFAKYWPLVEHKGKR